MVVYIAEEVGQLKDVTRYTRGMAGAELNVSVGVTRLGHEAVYITRLGKDPYGDAIYDFIESNAIVTDGITRDPDNLTGSYLKSKVVDGDPQVFYYRKHSAASHLNAADIQKVDFAGAKHLHLTGISAALSQDVLGACTEAIKKARENNMTISFDPNIRPTLWPSQEVMVETINRIAFQCDYVLPGIGEARILTGKETEEDICKFYIDNGAKAVIIKVGPKGAFYMTKDGDSQLVLGFKAKKVVDTVGAGDGFASGFLSGVLEDLPLADAIKRGNGVGAIIVQSQGDNEGLPTLPELKAFMAENA